MFEDTQNAVLYQNQKRVAEADLLDTAETAVLLHAFLTWQEPDPTSFDNAIVRFGDVIPALANGLIDRIERERTESVAFASAFNSLLELCRASLNPLVKDTVVVEMLAQHLLTERLFRTIFDNPDFVQRNVIAHKVEETIRVMMQRSFNRSDFTKTLDKYYYPIESKAREATEWEQKQAFLNSLYERFFQDFNRKAADTQGIVYTPQQIVNFMLESVERLLSSEFGMLLSDEGVVFLDPCAGTGNYAQNLVRRISPMRLTEKYRHELFCNENMLLPYYIASLNIEHAYYERSGAYEPFEGLCFTDTLMLEHAFSSDSTGNFDFFSEENADRVKAEQAAQITVIVGNPPYNVGQMNENDNNKNRVYERSRKRIHDTYAKDSKATLSTKVYDVYVQFFRWATDRLGDRDGIVAFISNNGFLTGIAFDGMRKLLQDDFTTIYHVDLGGNSRKEGGGSVFGIRVGVGITFLVRRGKKGNAKVFYHAVDDALSGADKLNSISAAGSIDGIDWQEITPDARYNWLNEGIQSGYSSLLPMGLRQGQYAASNHTPIFQTYSLGISTNRDDVVYDFDRSRLAKRIEQFALDYNAEVRRWQSAPMLPTERTTEAVDAFVDYSKIKWSRNLKRDLRTGKLADFDARCILAAAYRPFCAKWIYFADVIIDERGTMGKAFPDLQSEKDNIAMCVTAIGSEKPFMVFAVKLLCDLHLTSPGTGAQCFPFYTYDDGGTKRRENITDDALAAFQTNYSDDALTKQDIFSYVYAILHHPQYRVHYRENLKRELPRIPFVGDTETVHTLVTAGERLLALHTTYETADEYPLTDVYDQQATLADVFRVVKMRFTDKDKTALHVNPSLTLQGIPPEAHLYKLGSRSALEWLIDQYRVRGDSDPNRADDPRYIVRLVKRIVTVSVQTVQIVTSLPPLNLDTDATI